MALRSMSLISVRFFPSIQSAIEYHDRDLQQRLAWWISAFAFNLKLPLCQVMVITTDRVCICIGGGEGRGAYDKWRAGISAFNVNVTGCGFFCFAQRQIPVFLPKQTN